VLALLGSCASQAHTVATVRLGEMLTTPLSTSTLPRYFESCNAALAAVLSDLRVHEDMQARKGLVAPLGDLSALYVARYPQHASAPGASAQGYRRGRECLIAFIVATVVATMTAWVGHLDHSLLSCQSVLLLQVSQRRPFFRARCAISLQHHCSRALLVL
jgi:hypothetical protein